MESKRATVIMLPTEDREFKINCGCTGTDNCPYATCNHSYSNGKLYYHGDRANIYIITDDEIKEGDWFYSNVTKSIRQCSKAWSDSLKLKPNEQTGTWFKVIATTDKSLITMKQCFQCDGTGETTFSGTYTSQKTCDVCQGNKLQIDPKKQLPQPSQAFIEKYCKVGGIVK